METNQLFTRFYGNDSLKETLTRMLVGERFPHALLLEGEAGLGKRTLAGLVAAALLCDEKPPMRPCGLCPNCHKAFTGGHPDIHRVAGEKSFGIGLVREMREALGVLPNEGRFSVWILENVHTMTPQAQNALLKSLEEPPPSVRFILTTDSQNALLETIRSRVTTLTVRPLAMEACIAVMEERLPDRDGTLIRQAASAASGNLGIALQSLEDETFIQWLDRVANLAKAVAGGYEYDLMKALAPFEKDKDGLARALERLCLIWRDVSVRKSGGETVLSLSLIHI